MKYRLLSFALLAFFTGTAHAMPKDGCGGDCGTCHSLTQKEAATLLKGIGGDVKEVKPSPVRGLWEVALANQGKKAVVYVDYSKKFIVNGGIFDIATRKAVSGVPQQPKVEKVKVSAIPTGNSIVLGNPLAAKRLFLFTDPDCPFCAKQHAEIRKLVAKRQDISVYVKLNPLKIHPNAYDRARVLLQSQSPQLLDDAYAGKPLPAATPQTPSAGVDETMKVAQTLGLASTPTLVMPDGKVIVGFKTAEEIEKALNTKKGKK